MLEQISKQVCQQILKAHGTFHKAGQSTGLAKRYFYDLSKTPTWSNLMRCANASNIRIKVEVE